MEIGVRFPVRVSRSGRALANAVVGRGCSSVWLECRSVTPEAAGSSPVSPVCFLRESGLGDAGAVAQLGERLNGIQEVRGSTPLGSTWPADEPVTARVAELVDAQDSGSCGG